MRKGGRRDGMVVGKYRSSEGRKNGTQGWREGREEVTGADLGGRGGHSSPLTCHWWKHELKLSDTYNSFFLLGGIRSFSDKHDGGNC